MNYLINRLKSIRNQKLLTKRFSKQFAFVGVGAHSTSNLYPVIEYLRLDLPLIVVRDPRKANLINQNFIYTKGSNTLADITGNESITGVFVCSKPETHFGLVKLLLEANKNVFVEKPPCQNSNELAQLINIEKESKGFCMVGLQKRYAPATRTIKSKAKDISTYSYKYLTGAMPEGDPILELFIHPIDLAIYLFGDAEVKSVIKQKNGQGVTYFVHLLHTNGVAGALELSTDYSWTSPCEELTVNTAKGVFRCSNCSTLTFEPKSGTIMGIPLEKVLKKSRAVYTLQGADTFSPIVRNNQIYSSGYFSELEAFALQCETGKDHNLSKLTALIPVYGILEKLKYYE
jgi:virulence factor